VCAKQLDRNHSRAQPVAKFAQVNIDTDNWRTFLLWITHSWTLPQVKPMYRISLLRSNLSLVKAAREPAAMPRLRNLMKLAFDRACPWLAYESKRILP